MRRLGRLALLVDLVCIGTSVVLVQLAPATPPDHSSRGIDVFSLSIVTFGILGAVVMSRRPANRFGWLVALIAFIHAVGYLTVGLATYALYRTEGPLPIAPYIVWAFAWTAALHYVPSATFLLLLFPDGRLPSIRWRPIAWASLVAMVSLALGVATLEGSLPGFAEVMNPFGVPGPLPFALVGSAAVLTAISALASAVSLFARYRRARADERQQLKWFLYGGAIVVVAGLTVLFLGVPIVPATIVVSGSLIVLAAAAGIAVLRYRLYDIDLLIGRTLVYSALSAVLIVTYTTAVVLFQVVLRPLTGGSELAVAASTLMVVALAQPLRGQLQDIVDRRFYRSRYDAARTLDAFVSRLRDEVDLDAVRRDLLAVIDETVRPAHAAVWLREITR